MKSKSELKEKRIEYDDFLLLMDSIQDYAIIRLDTEGNVLSWNKGAEKIKGYKAEEIIGKNFSVFYLSEVIKKGIPQENLKLAKINGSYSETGPRVRKDGSLFWGDTIITALYTEDKQLRGFVKITRDISGRKELSDELELLHNQVEQTITERLNQALKENTDYKYALDESAIVAITDQKGIITHVNENFCKISKYNREELIDKDHRIINSGYHEKTFIRNLWTTIANGTIWKGELKNRAKDGSFYWVDTTIVPFLNDKGKPYQYVAIRSDITARKLNEEKITESERFIKTITENLPAIITYWDAGLYCRFANQPCLEWFDKTAPEILGIHKTTLFGAQDFALHEVHIKKVLDGNPQRFEYVFHKGNDKHIFADIQYLPDREDGVTKGFYSLIYDITEVKLAEIAEKFALEERNNILESIDDAFFAVDKNWIVTYWNKMAEKVLHTPIEDILGRHLWEVFPNTVGLLSYQKYHEALSTNQAVHFEDHYDLLNVWYEISAYPTGNGLSVYFKDITNRKTSERLLIELNLSLQQYTKDLATSNSDLEQFAYVASHDLQEPLRMITSFLILLEKKYGNKVDETGKRYLHFAVDGAKRMRQIILDLLEYSRVGRYENEPEDVDLNQLIEEILVLYRSEIKEKKAKVRFEGLPTISTHKTPIRQVLQNLIGNALKYQKVNECPEIYISSEEELDQWQLSVKDNGIGIDKEYFQKIFTIFQRLHNKDEYAGTGIGLAITKKIVDNMGGRIWVTSEINNGSTFYFTILKKIKK